MKNYLKIKNFKPGCLYRINHPIIFLISNNLKNKGRFKLNKNMNEELLELYQSMKSQMWVISKQIESIEKLVFEELEKVFKDTGEDKVKSKFGTLYFTYRKNWTYTDGVKNKELELKELKKSEEESGKANFEEKKILSFRIKKEDK